MSSEPDSGEIQSLVMLRTWLSHLQVQVLARLTVPSLNKLQNRFLGRSSRCWENPSLIMSPKLEGSVQVTAFYSEMHAACDSGLMLLLCAFAGTFVVV